jgi:hypothetical protein
MATTGEMFYWDDEDREDQEARRAINARRTYTDTACCNSCGTSLRGSAFQCAVCNSLVCALCICYDECCPTHTNAGREAL